MNFTSGWTGFDTSHIQTVELEFTDAAAVNREFTGVTSRKILFFATVFLISNR